MNIKPAPEQVDDWELKAAQYADSQTGGSSSFVVTCECLKENRHEEDSVH